MRQFLTPIASFGIAFTTTVALFGKTGNGTIVAFSFMVFLGASNALINNIIHRVEVAFRRSYLEFLKEKEHEVPHICLNCGCKLEDETN